MASKTISIVYSSAFIPFALFLIAATSITIIGIGLISPQIAMAQQQQPQANLTSVQQQQLIDGLAFEMGNVTFRHHMASVNGIQMHYVIGGHGDPVVLVHGWPQTWYEWHKIMPALAKNYTVVAIDLRGIGASSKPSTGNDGNTRAEDIYQLISQLGFQKIYLVAHDVGVNTAYPFAAMHPNNVSKLVILDAGVRGFTAYPPQFGTGQPWWFGFNQQPVAETLTAGKEREYLSYIFKTASYNPDALTEAEIDKYVAAYSAPDGMRGGFEYYKSIPIDTQQNKEHAKTKLTMPVLALGAQMWGGEAVLNSMKLLATDVRGGGIPFTGHWIPEEQPVYLLNELAKFFSGK